MHIVFFSLDSDAHELSDGDLLTTEEVKRGASYRYETDRVRFLNGRFWMRRLLARTVECDATALTVAERDGKAPQIKVSGNPLPLAWSLSRTGASAVLAIAKTGRVGIDIERISVQRDSRLIAESLFSTREQQLLRSVPEDAESEMFLRLWTAKEALSKAAGLGLSADWSSFTIDPVCGKGPILAEGRAPFMPRDWHLSCIGEANDLIGHVATDTPIEMLQTEDLRP